MGDDDLLAEQRAYYRARAAEYDEWWTRAGSYDRGPDHTAAWEAQVAVVETALATFGAIGTVLELAGGTGWWTQRLAATADDLTVVDASPEVLELNRRRVGRDDVSYVVADLFDWQPTRRYDVVFFSFWLSHVPRERFSGFWGLVEQCLRPGGRAFFIDNRHDPALGRPDPFVLRWEDDLHHRRVKDGTEFRVVKVMYEPDELRGALLAEGWRADIQATTWFIYGCARPDGRGPAG